jgi:hypothetical protein
MFNDQNEFVQNESPRIENVDNETSIIVQTSYAQLDQFEKMAKLIMLGDFIWEIYLC